MGQPFFPSLCALVLIGAGAAAAQTDSTATQPAASVAAPVAPVAPAAPTTPEPAAAPVVAAPVVAAPTDSAVAPVTAAPTTAAPIAAAPVDTAAKAPVDTVAVAAPPVTPVAAPTPAPVASGGPVAWIKDHTHGTMQYAMPHVEVAYTNGFRGPGILYRDRGGWMAEALISGAATEGNRQAAASNASPGSTYTYQQVTVSSPSLGLNFFTFAYEKKDTIEGDLAGAYLDFFYSIPMLEETLGLPIVLDIGCGFAMADEGGFALSLTSYIPITQWAQAEVNYRYGAMDNLDLSLVGNLTDAAFVRLTFAVMDDFADDGAIQTTFGFRL